MPARRLCNRPAAPRRRVGWSSEVARQPRYLPGDLAAVLGSRALSVRVAEAGVWGTTVQRGRDGQYRGGRRVAATALSDVPRGTRRPTSRSPNCGPRLPVVLRVLADGPPSRGRVVHLARPLPALVPPAANGDVRGNGHQRAHRRSAVGPRRADLRRPPTACAALWTPSPPRRCEANFRRGARAVGCAGDTGAAASALGAQPSGRFGIPVANCDRWYFTPCADAWPDVDNRAGGDPGAGRSTPCWTRGEFGGAGRAARLICSCVVRRHDTPWNAAAWI